MTVMNLDKFKGSQNVKDQVTYHLTSSQTQYYHQWKWSSHSTKTICQVDFKLSRCVAEGLKICMCAFAAVWMCDEVNISKNLCYFTLRASSSTPPRTNGDSATLLSLQPTSWLKLGLRLLQSLVWRAHVLSGHCPGQEFSENKQPY